MILSSIFPQLRTQAQRVKAQIAKLDLELTSRYGDRYLQLKQQLNSSRDAYDRARAEAEAGGTLPLDERKERVERRVAQAGSRAAQREGEIRQQLKQLWHSIKNKR